MTFMGISAALAHPPDVYQPCVQPFTKCFLFKQRQIKIHIFGLILYICTENKISFAFGPHGKV